MTTLPYPRRPYHVEAENSVLELTEASKESSILLHNPTTKVPCTEVTSDSKVLALLPVDSPHQQSRVHGGNSLSQFVLQSVDSRKIVPFRPNEKSAPNKILYYIVETLRCGHKLIVYPHPEEKLIARKRSCHECLLQLVQAVEGKKPVKGIIRSTRKKMTGNSVWPLVWALLATVFLIFWFWAHRALSYTFAEPIHVIRKIDDYSFVLQRVGQPAFTYHFCRDIYGPKLEQGMTLTWFSYEDRGNCISIAPATRGYVIQRNADGWPTLPKNCRHVGADVPAVCDGEPRF